MNILLHQLKIALISLIVLSTPTLACDRGSATLVCEPEPQAARNPNHGARYSGIINAGSEDFLIRSGQQLLRQVYSDAPVDHRNSKLFAETMVHLDPFKEKAKYSAVADWALVSNTVRWWNKSTDEDYVAKRKNHLAAILSVCWALAQQADDQGEQFKRGSFTVVDPGHKLYMFLLDYVKLVTGNDNPQSLPYEQTTSNFAYQREAHKGLSTHHKDRTPESQFGIDIRLEPESGVLMFLPYSYTHILFGKLDLGGQEKPLTFIKLEEIGLGSKGAFAAHMASLHRSLQFVEEDARREKDVRRELELSFGLLKEMLRLAKVKTPEAFPTIRSMFLFARGFEDKGNVPGAYEARDFLRRLDVNYPARNHDLRTGNEVIIDMPAFLMPKQ
jgi:hypothetical protein